MGIIEFIRSHHVNSTSIIRCLSYLFCILFGYSIFQDSNKTGIFTTLINSLCSWDFFQTLAIAGSLFFVGFQIKSQKISNMIAAIDILDKKWESKKMLKTRHSLCKNYWSKGIGRSDEKVLGFFEELGMYVKKEALDIKAVYSKYGFNIERYWILSENAIKDMRRKHKDDTFFEDFEFLYKKIKSYLLINNLPIFSSKDLHDFLNREIECLEELEQAYNDETIKNPCDIVLIGESE